MSDFSIEVTRFTLAIENLATEEFSILFLLIIFRGAFASHHVSLTERNFFSDRVHFSSFQ